MPENREQKLIIHTRIRPETEAAPQAEPKRAWRIRRASKQQKGFPWACVEPRRRDRRARHPQRRKRLTMGERLLRNSAIACALLLGILTLGNVDQPWARETISGVEQALTMRIRLDESLGSLSFVKNLVPESALVFFNVSGESELCRPVSGQVQHAWSQTQSWVLFACGEAEEVYASQDGTVTAITQLSGGGWGLLLDHGEGLESVYAYLAEPALEPGQAVRRGDVIGQTQSGGALYYELRQGGEANDPSGRMGL